MEDDSASKIYKIYPELKNNLDLIFAICEKEWLVVLTKLHEGKTDEAKINKYLYTQLKFRVQSIFNMSDPEKTVDEIVDKTQINERRYTVGETVYFDKYSFNRYPINIVYLNGFEYYDSLESALYYTDPERRINYHLLNIPQIGGMCLYN